MSLFLGGRTFFVPGAYGMTKVINAGGNAMPVFNCGIVIAKQVKGLPYLEGVGDPASKTGADIIQGYSDTQEAINVFGEDSELVTFFRYAKKGGAGTIFTLGVNPLTKLSDVVVKNLTDASFTLKSKGWGAQENDVQLTIAESIHTVIPPKNLAFLSADAADTDTIISVVNIGTKFRIGETILITDNALTTGPISATIVALNTDTNQIVLDAALGKDLTKVAYARVFQPDTEKQEVSTALTTTTLLRDFYANSLILELQEVVEEVVPPETLAATYLGTVTDATQATSPEAQAEDWQSIVDNFHRWNEEFALINKIYLRVIGLATSDAANQAAFRDLANLMRTLNKPVAIVTGAGVGDYLLADSESNSLVKRTLTLNSDDVQLAGVGLDGLPASLSYAGELFGIRLASDIIHNQTNDVVLALTVERAYFREDASYEKFVRAGIVMIQMSKVGWSVSQGVTTYQDHSVSFNTQTKKTYLITLRDLADFDLRGILETMDALAGEDGVTQQTVSVAAIGFGEKLKNDYKYITDYKIDRIYKEGNAWKVDRSVALDSPTDFIGITNTIVVD